MCNTPWFGAPTYKPEKMSPDGLQDAPAPPTCRDWLSVATMEKVAVALCIECDNRKRITAVKEDGRR